MENSKNLVNTILDAQKNVVDKFMNTTKKIYGNNPGTEMLEKGTEMYNDWVGKQKDAIDKLGGKTEDIQSNMKDQTEKAKDFYSHWYNSQIENTKKLWDANQQFFTQMGQKVQNPGSNMFGSNPLNLWSDAMKSYSQFINEVNNANKWANLFQQYNPMNYFQKVQQTMNSTPDFFNAYFEAVGQTAREFQNAFSNIGKQDVFGQMAGHATSYGKFMEIWTPFWNSIKEGSFSAEMFKNNVNAAQLKELTDKMFQLMPETYQSYFHQNNEFMKQFFQQNMEAGKTWYAQAKENMDALRTSYNPFQAMVAQYTQFNEFLNQSAAPFAKMATPNQYTKSISAWSAIFDKMTIYTVKNTELQYMMYLQGQKVMDALAEDIQKKIEEKTEITDFTQLYQEWLNISDKVYVELFESEEYSKLMAGVSALQLKIKKAVDTQIEESLSLYPIATKSELDELYKVIYDLKKEVRQLEKMLELDNNTESSEPKEAPAAATTSRTKRTPKPADNKDI